MNIGHRIGTWLFGPPRPFCSKCGCPMEERWTRAEGDRERFDPGTGAGVQPERLAWGCSAYAADLDLDSFEHDFRWLSARRDRPIAGRCE